MVDETRRLEEWNYLWQQHYLTKPSPGYKDFTFEVKNLNTHRKQKIFLQEWVQEEDNLIKALKHKGERGRCIVRYDANNKNLHAVMTQSDPRQYKFPASNSSSLCLFQELELDIRVESKVCTFNCIILTTLSFTIFDVIKSIYIIKQVNRCFFTFLHL